MTGKTYKYNGFIVGPKIHPNKTRSRERVVVRATPDGEVLYECDDEMDAEQWIDQWGKSGTNVPPAGWINQPPASDQD